MFTPTNEQGTIAVFMTHADAAGWKIIEIGTRFPDAKMKHNGEIWRVEFEFTSSNFVLHGHNYDECDIIICWVNNLESCPIPILVLSDPNWTTQRKTKGVPLTAGEAYWMDRAIRAEREVERQKRRITNSRPALKSDLDDFAIQKLMIPIYQRDPKISDEKMGLAIGVSKRKVQLLRDDLAKKHVIKIDILSKGKSVTVNGQLPAFLSGELN